MHKLYHALQEREQTRSQLRVGLVGCGQMGSGMVTLTYQSPGQRIRVIADLDVQRGVDAFTAVGLQREDIVISDQPSAIEGALQKGRVAVTADALVLATVPSIDAVIEATGSTEIGAQVAYNAILRHKHVIMLNVETDVTVGWVLKQMADQAGVIYTVSAGDEPGAIMELYQFAKTMGFQVVCLGKGKNNPIDRDATPESCHDEAVGKGMNPKMLAAFKDGSKTMVEMAAVSNATGLLPDVPGMHGRKVEIAEFNSVYIPEEEGGILSRRGCVEYTTGKVAPAVFAIVTTDDPRIHNDMRFVSMGDGPYYTLLRPYHLCNIETPLAIVDAVLYGEHTVASTHLFSEVVPVAKRDLSRGEIVGEIGGGDYYGIIMTHPDAAARDAIPLGVTPGAKVIEPVAKGELLTTQNLTADRSRFVYKLRELQDAATLP